MKLLDLHCEVCGAQIDGLTGYNVVHPTRDWAGKAMLVRMNLCGQACYEAAPARLRELEHDRYASPDWAYTVVQGAAFYHALFCGPGVVCGAGSARCSVCGWLLCARMDGDDVEARARFALFCLATVGDALLLALTQAGA